MKNRLLKITILTIMIIMYLQVFVFASTLKLNITADKEELEIGEEVKIKVSWDTGMQAADFSLLYDSKKLEYVGSNLEDYFINSTEGELKTAWISLDNTDKTEVEYTFKAKKSGKVDIATKVNGGFATGNLQIPEAYEEGNLEIKVLGGNLVIPIVIIAVILVILICVIIKRTKK